tara:strand:+ start:3201 stop:3848 length:648 start_codon:yes stop_codon:yes gene_type:complete
MPYTAIAGFKAIRDKVRQETLDVAGTRWTDEELDTYINIAQESYARRTKSLTGSVDVYFDGLNDIFQVPTNYIRATKFQLPDTKEEIPLTSWKVLSSKFTPKFLNDTNSDIYYCCFDYESWNRFRFYPNPSVDAGTLLGTLSYARKPVKDVIEIRNQEALVAYVLFRSYLKERNAKFLKKASEYRTEFERHLPKSKSRSTKTMSRQSGARSGRFF